MEEAVSTQHRILGGGGGELGGCGASLLFGTVVELVVEDSHLFIYRCCFVIKVIWFRVG